MNYNNQFCVKFIHCGNISIANPEDKEQKNIFFMPMGLFPMADVLNKNGLDVEIIHSDLEVGKTIDEILDFAQVDMVGFDNHWVNESVVVMETAELIKKINPEIFVVIGGFTASLFAGEILASFPQIDAVVKGDGEVPILELVRVLQEEKLKGKSIVKEPDPQRLKKVQNLVWRENNHGIITNKHTYTAANQDLERLDFAAVDFLRNWQAYTMSSFFYTHFEPINSSPMFLLEVARGCEYVCTFCGGNALAQKKMNNRTKTASRTVDSVLTTINKAISHGFETFYTSMEWENSDEWYIQLFNRVKEEKLEINYAYGCWRLPSRELVDAMTDACKEVIIELSPETSSNQLRKKNKDIRIAYTNDQMETCLDYISTKDNVKVQVFFGFYVSGDTLETVLNTSEYILKLLAKYPGLLEIEYANFSTDPGSLFFFNPEKYGIDIKVRNYNDYIKYLKENYVDRKGQQADMTVFKPSGISDEEHAYIFRIIRLFNYLMGSFRKSVSYMLEKTGSPEVILSILKESYIALTPDNRFPPEEIKILILGMCTKRNILDNYLIKLVSYECEKIKSERVMSKPTTQFYMDLEPVEELQKDETFDSMIDYIDSGLNNDPEDNSMNIEFNFEGE